MDEVYVVCKHGVYCHGVHYATTSKDGACRMAEECALGDGDSYHTWEVHRIPLNQLVVMQPFSRGDGFCDEPSVARYRRDEAMREGLQALREVTHG